MSKRLLIVAATTGYQTRVFADAAARCGYDVQLATDHCHRLDDPWGDHAIPVRFHEPERAAERVLAAGVKLDGVVAVGDRPAYIASVIAQELGLPYSPPEAVLACRSKFESRGAFESAGLLVPAYTRVPLDADLTEASHCASYPCVLKPLGLSASRGVIRANNPAEFVTAFRRISDILAAPDVKRMREEQNCFIQVEEFIPGQEFALEGVVTAGALQTLAIFDKPEPLDGPFFEETIYVTPSRIPLEQQRAIIDTTARAVTALGLVHGPVHAEMRVNDRGVHMLEVAARPIGGLCARVLRFTDGSGLEELVCRHAAGDPLGSTQLADPARAVMMIPIPEPGLYLGVDGVENAAAVTGIEAIEITAKHSQRLVQLPESGSYLGFIFGRGENPQAAEEAVRRAHACLSFRIAPMLKVI